MSKEELKNYLSFIVKCFETIFTVIWNCKVESVSLKCENYEKNAIKCQMTQKVSSFVTL